MSSTDFHSHRVFIYTCVDYQPQAQSIFICKRRKPHFEVGINLFLVFFYKKIQFVKISPFFMATSGFVDTTVSQLMSISLKCLHVVTAVKICWLYLPCLKLKPPISSTLTIDSKKAYQTNTTPTYYCEAGSRCSMV